MRTTLLCAILLCLVPALADAAACGGRPRKPAFPDPNKAASEQAQRLAQDMQAYSTGMNAYVTCLTKEIDEAQQEGTSTITSYNQDFLGAYNRRITQ